MHACMYVCMCAAGCSSVRMHAHAAATLAMSLIENVYIVGACVHACTMQRARMIAPGQVRRRYAGGMQGGGG